MTSAHGDEGYEEPWVFAPGEQLTVPRILWLRTVIIIVGKLGAAFGGPALSDTKPSSLSVPATCDSGDWVGPEYLGSLVQETPLPIG